MKTKLAILALAATSVAANAAYIFSSPDQDSTGQPSAPRVTGVQFNLSAPAILDKFAVYDYSGNFGAGWTAATAKTVALFELSSGTYTQIATKTLTTNAGMTSVPNLIGEQDFFASSFAGLSPLSAGSYFIGLVEVNTSFPVFDGFVVPDPANGVSAGVPQVSGYTLSRLGSGTTTMPGSFLATALGGTQNVMVIPSLVNVPEAGSSVMALALGAMVLRFRSRRA